MNCQQCQMPLKEGARFCPWCGTTLQAADVGQGLEKASNQEPDTSSTKTQYEAGNAKVMAVVDGEGTVAGRDIIIQQPNKPMYCAYGGEQVYEGRNFRCPNCGLEPLCAQHFYEGQRKCSGCTTEGTLPCAICDDRLPLSQLFTCERCHLMVGADHKDQDREWCNVCSGQYVKIIDAMERDAVGISVDGTVVGQDDVQLKNGVLMDKSGNRVSQIKNQTWYVGSKHWHKVRPALLRRERQAVERYYPNLSLHDTGDGSLYWQGFVKTWQGNEYEVKLSYPSNFPYGPLRAYVLNPKIEESRHIYPDGHLCLFHKDDKAWEPQTTGATVASWVSLWLHCYEVWTETGNWPRPEADQVVNKPKY